MTNINCFGKHVKNVKFAACVNDFANFAKHETHLKENIIIWNNALRKININFIIS